MADWRRVAAHVHLATISQAVRPALMERPAVAKDSESPLRPPNFLHGANGNGAKLDTRTHSEVEQADKQAWDVVRKRKAFACADCAVLAARNNPTGSPTCLSIQIRAVGTQAKTAPSPIRMNQPKPCGRAVGPE